MKQIIDIDETMTKGEYGFSASRLVESEGLEEPKPKKRGPGRPRNPENQYGSVPANTYTNIVTEDSESAKRRRSSFEGQIEKKYEAQVAMIADVVTQTNQMISELNSELQKYQEKPGYGGKSRNLAINNLHNTRLGLLNTKLTAARDLTYLRNKINDLVMQDRKMSKDEGLDDTGDKAVMDAYYALVNASKYGLPQIAPPLHPASINTGVNLQGAPINTATIGSSAPIIPADGSAPIVPAVNQYGLTPGMNPIQQKMILEKNPNVKTVVVYNQSTGSKRFDIVDVSTGMSIPGVQRPAPFLLDDMKPDIRNGIAANSNVNMVFPLVIEGTRAVDEL